MIDGWSGWIPRLRCSLIERMLIQGNMVGSDTTSVYSLLSGNLFSLISCVSELSKAVEPHIKQEDEGKFRCKTCQKLFKATSFVEKHISNKHPELIKVLDEVRGEHPDSDCC